MMENFTMIMKPPTSGASNRRNCLGRGTTLAFEFQGRLTTRPSPNQASPSSQTRSPGWHHGKNPWEDTQNRRAHWGPLRPARTGTCRGCSCWASCATSPANPMVSFGSDQPTSSHWVYWECVKVAGNLWKSWSMLVPKMTKKYQRISDNCVSHIFQGLIPKPTRLFFWTYTKIPKLIIICRFWLPNTPRTHLWKNQDTVVRWTSWTSPFALAFACSWTQLDPVDGNKFWGNLVPEKRKALSGGKWALD